MKPVRIVAKNPDIDIEIPMGDGPALPVGGLGGWTTVALQDDIEGVDWEGQDPLTEDLPLLLNGLERDESVEREWKTVQKLGRDARGDERRPPVFRVWGPVEHPGKAWVLPRNGIEVLSPDENMIKRNGDGELLRVEFVLHLLEYVPPELIKARRRRKRKRQGISDNIAVGGTYTTDKVGETLESIATKLFRDPHRWKELAAKNNRTDPDRPLPVGTRLRV